MIEKMIVEKGGQTSDAEDVFQDTLLILLSKSRQPDFKLTSKLSTLLYAIARNRWTNVNYHRQKFTTLDRQKENADENSEKIIDIRLPAVKEAINQLSEGCRHLITAYFYRQLDYTEIGAELNQSANYLKVKMHRCMTKIRNIVFPPSNPKSKSL